MFYSNHRGGVALIISVKIHTRIHQIVIFLVRCTKESYNKNYDSSIRAWLFLEVGEEATL